MAPSNKESSILLRLDKLAQISGALRQASFKKEAVLGAVLGMAARNPLKTIGAASLAIGAKGQMQTNTAGFNPKTHQALLGQTPQPPGT